MNADSGLALRPPHESLMGDVHHRPQTTTTTSFAQHTAPAIPIP